MINNILTNMLRDGELTQTDYMQALALADMIGEDSPEAVANALDLLGIDGMIAYDYALDY